MDNSKIATWLKQLLKYKRQDCHEQEEFNQFTGDQNDLIDAECKDIQSAINELEKPEECICRELTLDEAIEHAREVSTRNSSMCSRQHAQLANWLEQLKNLKCQYASLHSDFVSLKARLQKEKELAEANAKKNILLGILNVVDDMNRLVKEEVHFRDLLDDISSMDVGFELIVENMMKFLAQNGCTKIDAEEGCQFNVDLHEAISMKKIDKLAKDYFKENDIAEVIQDGWLLDGKLLRATKVIVYER